MDRGVIAAASELLQARHYPGVVALVGDALEAEPECVPLLLLRARAQIALRRDLDAQGDLRDIIRLDPRCGAAFRLLGELAARRNENQSAAIFFREALRLAPDDQEARDWLRIVDASLRPAAVANKLPAPAPAAGRVLLPRASLDPARGTTGQPTASSPARGTRASQPRFASGTQSPDELEGRETRPFARSSAADGDAWQPAARPLGFPQLEPPKPTLTGRPDAPAPARAAPRVYPRPISRSATELPGFGEYLVTAGILTRERLRAAQAYQRSMKVQLATAIVTLGLATPQRIEWAAVSHQSELARSRA